MSSTRHEPTMVTRELARLFRSTMEYPRQRTVRDENVRRLAQEMAKHRFIPATQIYVAELPDGTQWLLNGNHTLEAIILSGEPQNMVITYQAVADEAEADRIYAVFDIHKTRTWHDSLKATGQAGTHPMAAQALSAIGLIENHFDQFSRPGMVSRIERLELLESYSDAIELFAAARARSGSRDAARLALRAGVMGVALETLRYQPSAGCEFWELLMQDDGLRTGEPAKALLTWLRNITSTGGAAARSEHARASALCWNAHFRRKNIQYAKPNAMTAFYLLGTPWAKGLRGEGSKRKKADAAQAAFAGLAK